MPVSWFVSGHSLWRLMVVTILLAQMNSAGTACTAPLGGAVTREEPVSDYCNPVKNGLSGGGSLEKTVSTLLASKANLAECRFA